MEINEVRNNYGKAEKFTNSTQKGQETTEKTYKNAKEYSNYLSGKYSCLQEKNGSSVSISPDLLSKAATDSKTSQWLEENLKLIPDVMNSIYQDSAQNGSRVLSCNISFDGYDSMTTQVDAVYEVETGTEDMKKRLEEILSKNKEQKKNQEKLLDEKENSQYQKFLTTDADSLLQKVKHFDFAHKNGQNRVSIDSKV